MGEIKLVIKGPLIIEGAEIKDKAGINYAKDEGATYLCRCGGSNKKPHCDGSHSCLNFDGTRERSPKSPKENREKKYIGEKITIYFDPYICCHAAQCTKLESVFLKDNADWIKPNGDSVEKIIETIKKCPSGALAYEIDGVKHNKFFQKENPLIKTIERGPYNVKGAFILEDDQESRNVVGDTDHFALCRCGKSKKKPFCDGAHRELEKI